jgi:NAD+ synthase (glutamine-hydrolysing)
MKITLAQLDPFIGDIHGNIEKIISILNQHQKDSPDLVVFPELFLTGYPPRDLLEKNWFIQTIQKAIKKLITVSKQYPHTGILVGAPTPSTKKTGRRLYNSALLIYQGTLLHTQHKSLLPTYDVFDEARYFDSASQIDVVPFKDEILGISICEDAWNDPDLWPERYYPIDPIERLAKKGSTLLINISASPFHVGKEEIRFRIFQNHAKKHKTPFLFVNQVGGNDELIFDGRSIFFDNKGQPLFIAASFQEQIHTLNTSTPPAPVQYHPQEYIESIYQALLMGIRDYMRKCGFSKAVLGVSGGIDSAVVCCLAQASIGRENIIGVTMPGPFSSKGSIEDSKKLAETLGITFLNIPITSIYQSYLQSLSEPLNINRDVDVTLENIQARIRGNILMALSNKYGYLVLSTGNKSELSVGYCTLYGDMSGGLAVISDVPKTMVYQLAQYINRNSEIIPNQTLEKPPSAELRPDQKDSDTLPSYEILDEILQLYVNEGSSMQDILRKHNNSDEVHWVIHAVNRNEYKRRQAAPGLKVTPKAFGVGRRMPIAAKYEEVEDS